MAQQVTGGSQVQLKGIQVPLISTEDIWVFARDFAHLFHFLYIPKFLRIAPDIHKPKESRYR